MGYNERKAMQEVRDLLAKLNHWRLLLEAIHDQIAFNRRLTAEAVAELLKDECERRPYEGYVANLSIEELLSWLDAWKSDEES